MQGPAFSSSFLEALDKLVRSIDPDQLPKTSKKRCRSNSPVDPWDDGNRLADTPMGLSDSEGSSTSGALLNSNRSDLFLETDDESLSSPARPPSPPSSPPAARAPPKSTVVPRLSLAVGRSELDDQLEEIEREIEALMTYWERWSGTDGSAMHWKTDRSWKRPQEDPLGPRSAYVHEDPGYDELRVEKEALRDYEAELSEVAVERAGRLKEDVRSLVGRNCVAGASRERPVASTPSAARLPCGKLVPLKNLSVCLRRLRLPSSAWEEPGCASDADSDNEGERLEGLQKPARGRGTGRSASAPSSAPEGRPSKPYPFRRPRRAVRDTSGGKGDRLEEGGKPSEGSSEDTGSPAEDAGEGDEAEERERAPVLGRNRRRGERHPGGPHRHECPECGRVFGNSSNMWKHLRIHRGEKPFGCHACGKSFSDPSNLTKHQRAHADLDRRPHRCSLCPKAYFLKGDLDAHFRQHQGIRPFSCLDCPSRFFSQAHLRAHMNIHVFGRGAPRRPGRAVVCEECGKACGSARHLRLHMRFHRRFECQACGRFFSFKYDYKVHLASHRGPCGRCGVVGLHLCERQRPGGQSRHRLVPGVQEQRPDPERCPPKPSSASAPSLRPSCPEKLSLLSTPDPTRATIPDGSSDSAQVLRGPPQPPKPSSSISPLVLGDKTTRPSELCLTALQSPPGAPQASEMRPLPGPERPEPLQANQVVVASPQGSTRDAVQTMPLPGSGTFRLLEDDVRAPAVSASPDQLAPLILMMGPLAPQGTGVTNSGGQPVRVPPPNIPILWLINLSPLSVPPSGKDLAGVPSEFPQRSRPSAEASPVSPACSPAPLANSNRGPLTLTIPVNGPSSASTLPDTSPTEEEAARKGLILINPATLPPGTKITLEIPARNIVPTLPAPRVCLRCQAKYFGNHVCKVRASGPVRRDEQESIQFRLQDEEKSTAPRLPAVGSQQPHPVDQLAPQEGEEPSSCNLHSDVICLNGNEGDGVDSPESSPARSYNLRDTRSKVVYVDGEGASEVERDTDSSWQGEEEESSDSEDDDDDDVPLASHRKTLPAVSASGGRSQAGRRKGRYLCDICDKRFVYARSLRQHLRLHCAFSCDRCSASFIRREQLSRHKAGHAEEAEVA